MDPCGFTSLLAETILAAVEWPFAGSLPPPPERAITSMALVLLGQAWFGLTCCRIGLAILRHQMPGVLNQWVPVTTALRVGFVSLVLLAPILLGTICLVVPGLYLFARWSQVAMVLIDDRAKWFDATDQSAALTAGYRWQIVLVLGVVTAFIALVGGLVSNITALACAWRAAASTFGAALTASLYYQLSLRAPWNPEPVPYP